MSSLNTRLSFLLSCDYTKIVGLAKNDSPVSVSKLYSLVDGTGANQNRSVWSSAARAIAGSGSETLDLQALTDAFGDAIVFTKIKGIYVAAAAANVDDVVVGGVGSNAFVSPFGSTGDKVNVKPGGMIFLVAPDANGYAVSGSAHLLKVADSGSGGVTYDIALFGCP